MNNLRCNLMIYYAILLQFITVLFVLFSSEPVRVVRLGVFYQLFKEPYIGALLMLLGVILAIIGLMIRGRYRFGWLLFLPQQAFLLLTAGSALSYTFQGHYADGVIRGWGFIFLDQLPSFVATFLYMFAFISFTKKEKTKIPPLKLAEGMQHGTK